MGDEEPDWNLYRTFIAVARKGTFSGAARTLGSTQPTIGRQIEALENALGVKLFTRSQRGLLPTDAARRLLPLAETMAASAEALRRESSGEANEDAGTVRLTAGAQFGIEILPPILADFARDHPGIELELSISSDAEDILHRDADIAVRMSRPRQGTLVARRLGKVRIGLFAHRSYVDRYGLPGTISDMSSHRLIGFDRNIDLLATFGGVAATMRREDFAFRTDNVIAQLALLKAGLGIGACHVNLARRNPDLVPVLAGEIAFEREVWLVVHPDLRETRRIRLLFDHLARGLKDYLPTRRR